MQKPHCSACASWNASLQRVLAVRRSPSTVRSERPSRLHGEHQARAHRLAVDQHRAGAADAVLAADLGAGQPELVAQEVGQQRPRLDLDVVGAAVDLELILMPRRLERLADERGQQRARCSERDAAGERGRARALAPLDSARSAAVARTGDRAGAEQRDGGAARRRRRPRRRRRSRSRRAYAPARRTRSAPAGSGGTSISTSSSSGSSAVISGPRKSSPASSVRAPPAERTWKRASSAASATGSSAAGSACATEPPTVPRVRICGWATSRTAWRSSGQRAATSRERSSAAWRVSAPIRSGPRGGAVGERRDAVEVDQPLGPREPEVEHRHQALAAGQRPRVVAEQRERLVEGLGRRVLERRGLHAARSRAFRRVGRVDAAAAERGRHGVPDRGRGPDRPALADALRPERVARRRRLHERGRDLRHLGGLEQPVVGERGGRRLAVLVVDHLLGQARRRGRGRCRRHLALGQQRVDDPARVVDRGDPRTRSAPRRALDLHHRGVGPRAEDEVRLEARVRLERGALAARPAARAASRAASRSAEPAIAVERLANVPTPAGAAAESPNRSSTSSGSTPSASATIWANVVS